MSGLQQEVATRIRAVMEEFQIPTNRDMGDLCGAHGGAVNNWRFKCGNLPRVPEMIRLCGETGITLDWLYRGHMGVMDPKLGIRLAKRLKTAVGSN